MARLQIIDAKPVGCLCVELLFNDNKRQIVNVGEFIRRHPHPQYNKYLDQSEFEKFSLDDGNVVWGEDWDLIFPIEEMYLGTIASSCGRCSVDGGRECIRRCGEREDREEQSDFAADERLD